MTHAELVVRAEQQLMNIRKCGFVLTEFSTASKEIPDAIGQKGTMSYMIECKATRSDFLSDKTKPFRKKPERGVGNYRYYMTPPDLISADDLPEKQGLLWVWPKKIKIVKKPSGFYSPKIAHNERILLCSALRRVYLRGDLEKIYQPLRNFA